PSIYHVLAGAYEKLEDPDTAIKYYEMSLNLDASDEECLLNYVEFLSTESNQVALDYLEMFEEINSDNALLKVLKVSVLWNLGHAERSIELFKKCLTIDRDKALEIFDINPALKNVPEFVLLGDQ
ncbi:MAG: tetratricopeptide repeat protein, partial [Crocinitomicaceae bacterium]|nr:tetratricopeptide repeat protein [Crocinitomicaceae bacterium]